jgi:capsular polysaccharide transport system permease protein
LAFLNRQDEFKKAYTRPSIFFLDRFNPWGSDQQFEKLFKYYRKKVAIGSDASTSIATLTVRAYDPESAQKFNSRLLRIAEATVNRLNTRGRQDLVNLAKEEVSEARANAQRTAAALSNYRNTAGVVDPEKQATIQLQMVSKLQDELVAARTRLREVQSLAPENPQIPVLESRIRELTQEIGSQTSQIAGGSRSLSTTAMRYQRLLLESQFAERQVAGAMTSLEEAMSEARRKQAYVETIVKPNRPDEALEPRRWKGILSTLVLSLLLYGIMSMILSSFREHLD